LANGFRNVINMDISHRVQNENKMSETIQKRITSGTR